jgi:hypothetical protein
VPFFFEISVKYVAIGFLKRNKVVKLQVIVDSNKPPSTWSGENKFQAQKRLVEDLKIQWKLLWSNRYDDRVKGEGVSVKEYETLYVEQGTVIHATRDFKALNFKEILDKHLIDNPDRYIQPNVETGGWNKFIKNEVTDRRLQKKNAHFDYRKSSELKHKQQKKSGRGWLHQA